LHEEPDVVGVLQAVIHVKAPDYFSNSVLNEAKLALCDLDLPQYLAPN
jgi:hypothetical protein